MTFSYWAYNSETIDGFVKYNDMKKNKFLKTLYKEEVIGVAESSDKELLRIYHIDYKTIYVITHFHPTGSHELTKAFENSENFELTELNNFSGVQLGFYKIRVLKTKFNKALTEMDKILKEYSEETNIKLKYYVRDKFQKISAPKRR